MQNSRVHHCGSGMSGTVLDSISALSSGFAERTEKFP